MIHRYDYNAAVRVIRNVRDDGTFPGRSRGELLIPRGAIGHVVDVGTFLQDQIIYRVHFLEQNLQVGCREEELITADAPWSPSRFAFRDKVRACRDLAIGGELRVASGAEGQVIKVIKQDDSTAYQVCFTDKVYQVAEHALEAVNDA